MTATVGYSSLLLALALAAWGIAAPVLGARTGREIFFASVRGAIVGQFMCVTLASLALIYALVTTDFSLKYVALNTTRATPIYYRVTGLWGALEGSLLLWEWILIIFAGLLAWIYRDRHRELLPWVLLIFSGVSAFFLAVMAFASNPFEPMFPVPLDGRGLNPLLEDANMLTHPPLLYTGFVGLTVPYAFAMAALITGKLDEAWIVTTRRGTIFPLLSEAVAGVTVSVGAPYFNQITTPLFLALVFLMGVGPLIAWRKASLDHLRRNLLGPAALALAGGLILFAWGLRDFSPLLAITLCAIVALTIGFDTTKAVRARRAIAGEGVLGALAMLVRRNQRRYGGFIVHLGVVLIVLGIAGSMSYSVEREITLQAGEAMTIDRFHIQFEGLRASQQPTHLRVEGLFRVANNGHDLGVLNPALKYYPTQQSPIGRAVFRSTLTEDLYLILSGFSEVREGRATLKAMVRPLVAWIWLGGAVMTLGTLAALWPFRPRAQREK